MTHAYGAVSVGAATGLILGGAHQAGMARMRAAVRAREEAEVAGQWQRALTSARRAAHANAVRAQNLETENELLIAEVRRLQDEVRHRNGVIRAMARGEA